MGKRSGIIMDSVSLAEPRRRQKWTLNPRGNLWANDESKFGQKLMEKMGWEKGKGLGAKGDGMTQHISLKLKDNNKGIGFDGHDDTWLAHQNDFQSVLAALNIEHGEAGKDLSETEKKANLEELSKKSRRRVHYQKFVRGKDTNNYSVEDLGCILGTKSEKVKSKSAPSSPKPDDDTKDEEEEKEDKRFVSGGSYADYFAKKMAELKAKGKFSSVPTSSWTSTPSSTCDREDVQRIGFSGTEETEKTSKKKKKSKKSEFESVENTEKNVDITENNIEEVEDNSEVVKKKKKKSKKREASPVIDDVTESSIVPASGDENLQPEKKRKKKSKKERIEEVTVEEETPVDTEIASKKKKSKKEKKEVDEIPVSEEIVPQEKKKKSKKNKKEVVEIENNEAPQELQMSCEEGKKKKSKKSKKQKEVEEASPVEEDSGCENEDTKYKKAKKGKKEKTKEKKTTYSDEEKENRRKRKSESEENPAQSEKKLKLDDENRNDTKFAGFKGSNLLSISGYGV